MTRVVFPFAEKLATRVLAENGLYRRGGGGGGGGGSGGGSSGRGGSGGGGPGAQPASNRPGWEQPGPSHADGAGWRVVEVLPFHHTVRSSDPRLTRGKSVIGQPHTGGWSPAGCSVRWFRGAGRAVLGQSEGQYWGSTKAVRTGVALLHSAG